MVLSDDDLREIYETTSTIATVGASTDHTKAASVVPRYMQLMGFGVLPVHPSAAELYGVAAHRRLDDVAEQIDVVDVFRPATEAPEIARAAARVGAKVLWLQDGSLPPDVADDVRAAGVTVVDGCCIAATYSRLGLGPDPLTALREAGEPT